MRPSISYEVRQAKKWEEAHGYLPPLDTRWFEYPKDGTPDWEGKTISWAELVYLEPTLKDLFNLVKAIHPATKVWCSHKAWYGVIKPHLLSLVGAGCRRKNPALRSEIAYRVAYHTILREFPPCRGCECVK